MRGLKLIPDDVNIPFIPLRKFFFAFSISLVVASLAIFFIKGLSYGIDFKGGILIEVHTPGNVQIGQLRSDLRNLGLGDVSLQTFGNPNEVLIRIGRQSGGETAQLKAVATVKAALGKGIEYRRTEFVGPKVSSELLMDGVYAVLAAMIAILGYVWVRFEWQFGLAAVVALVHDVTSTIGLFSLLGLEFNLTTVAAVLTIAGYSINDTVVVFDRVRETLRKYKTMPLPELFNRAINETLSRTLITSLTTLLALVALFILGGPVIHDFSLAMIWGIVVGTYSSICVAVPMLLYMNLQRRGGKDDKNTEEAPTHGAA
ncbi:protein translocase subunit SecF [Varunaivibrio sulfuroxidans]|uniref:Protein-export membrane protein SecF n=1 Tax=Varunaivibrio sulfuroxidans TaxID=1773489 RepID=A0A4R3J9P4_9PROT|nr:protein translocase subunit SecF [Varunaivibrio sulfuroxidans]TCS61310.1 protein translocase subunit secF [Varunaivibrio sulfuroxidans]WES31076.1 protein translocase subunit SecF [Varunaivibrio sulfuroxidans]